MEHFYSLYHWAFRQQPVVTRINFFHKLPLIINNEVESLDVPDCNSNYLIGIGDDIVNKDTSNQNNSLDECSECSCESDGAESFELIKSAIIRKEKIQLIQNIIGRSWPKKLWLLTNSSGDNLLHIATRHEHLDAMEYFLSLGIRIDSKNSRGDTPLHIALLCSSIQFLQVTKVLVDNGADLNSVDDNGNSFAHLCASCLNLEQYRVSVNCLISLGYSHLFSRRNNLNQTPLHIAILRRMDIDMETLMNICSSSGFNFNERYSEGDTLLHYAARWAGNRTTFENIIELGGDWRLRNNYLKTILHSAVAGSNIEAIKYFCSLGADVNARDMLGRTPLHHLQFSRKECLVELTKLLLEYCADINATDDCGNTVVHHLSMKIPTEEYAKWSSFVNMRTGDNSMQRMRENCEHIVTPN